MKPASRLLILAIAVSIAQIGFLLWSVAGRAAILRDGREVLLKVEPIDPRDLLRGDYVRLGYEISRLPVSILAGLPADAAEVEAGPIFVRLRKADDGFWRAVGASVGKPLAVAPTPEEVDIRGFVEGRYPLKDLAFLPVDYGIERFYLPEGEGLAIERDMRVRNFGIKVAVAQDGGAQLKALVDGDVTLFQEPHY